MWNDAIFKYTLLSLCLFKQIRTRSVKYYIARTASAIPLNLFSFFLGVAQTLGIQSRAASLYNNYHSNNYIECINNKVVGSVTSVTILFNGMFVLYKHVR